MMPTEIAARVVQTTIKKLAAEWRLKAATEDAAVAFTPSVTKTSSIREAEAIAEAFEALLSKEES